MRVYYDTVRPGEIRPPIATVVWPESLEKLTIGPCLDEPIDGIIWPDALIEMVFIKVEEYSTEYPDCYGSVATTWPIAKSFNQPIAEISQANGGIHGGCNGPL
eukprot:g5713.t1